MKRILLAGLAFSALIMPAMAADVAPYNALPPPVWSWTGFYVGANVGWAGSADSIVNSGTDTGGAGLGRYLVLGGIPGRLNLTHTGVIGGGQIGYNWQVLPTGYWASRLTSRESARRAATPSVAVGN
jgi:outer membrane immunogenic protein